MVIDHYGQETSSGEYKCDQCPKIFGWKSNLIRHQAAHEEGRRYVCENCRKVFTDPSNLQRHIRSQHIGARSHACPECGKTFATSSGLKQHTHIHSSVKPFQCEVCLKSYTQFSNLCRHKRMHADCRLQIKCHKCGQAFSTVTSLSKHKRFCEGGGGAGAPGASSSSATATSTPAFLAAAAAAAAAFTSSSSVSHHHDLKGTMSLAQQASHPQPPGGNPLMFYPRQGFSFYPPSLVAAYPMFGSGGSGLQPPHPSLLAANPLLLAAAAAKKPDSPDSSQLGGPLASAMGLPPGAALNGGLLPKKEKRASEGSESEISDDVSSAGISDDVDVSTGSDSESDGDRPTLLANGGGIKRRLHHHHHHHRGPPHRGSSSPQAASSPREGFSPKHAAIYPDPLKEHVLANGGGNALKALSVACPPADAPFDLSVGGTSGSKARMSPAAKPPRRHHREDEAEDDRHRHPEDDDQPLDLRVDRKKASPRVVKEERHRTHVFGASDVRKSMLGTPVSSDRTTPLASGNIVNHHSHPHDSGGGASPTTTTASAPPMPKFAMAHPRPIHPLLVAPPQLYKAAKYPAGAPAFPSAEMMMPLPPRYPFLGPLMNGLNGGVNGSSAFDMLRSQMEKMGKPYQDVLAPHVNKLKERYSCKFCGKIFPRSANLTRHLRTHTGEQPYKCKYCERSFSISSNLQRHVRNIHNKEKPFKCPLCDRCFGQQTNLDRHLKKHESDGPTILDDSPKSSDLNEKDDAYFDEIRNFIGKVTEPAAHALVAPPPLPLVAPNPPPPQPRPPTPRDDDDDDDQKRPQPPSPKRRKTATPTYHHHDDVIDDDDDEPLSPASAKTSPAREGSAPGSPRGREREVAYEVTMKVNGSGDKNGGEPFDDEDDDLPKPLVHKAVEA